MNQGQTPALEFRNVSISFDDVKALQNVSFTLPRGEMIWITGDSDAGKSVLLRLALGFLRVRCGAICLIALFVAPSDQETCASKQLVPGFPYTQLQTALGSPTHLCL